MTERLDHEFMALETALAAGEITKKQADYEYNYLIQQYEEEVAREAEDAYDQHCRNEGIY